MRRHVDDTHRGRQFHTEAEREGLGLNVAAPVAHAVGGRDVALGLHVAEVELGVHDRAALVAVDREAHEVNVVVNRGGRTLGAAGTGTDRKSRTERGVILSKRVVAAQDTAVEVEVVAGVAVELLGLVRRTDDISPEGEAFGTVKAVCNRHAAVEGLIELFAGVKRCVIRTAQYRGVRTFFQSLRSRLEFTHARHAVNGLRELGEHGDLSVRRSGIKEMLIVDALHVLVEEEARHDFFGVLDLHLSRAVNNLTIEHSVADSQFVLGASFRKQSQRTDTGLGVPRQRLAGNIREADFAGDSTAADNCLVVAKLILFNNDGTHVKDCQPGHFRMVCIHVRGNQSRRVDMFNIAERISGVINVVVGVLVICHELREDRVISRTHNQLRGTGASHLADCCRGISLARSFSQAEVLGNLSLGVLVVNSRAGKRDTSLNAGGKTFNRQYTVTVNGHSTSFTSQGLQRQIGIFCHRGGTICCRLQGLDSENTVINSHRTTGQGHFGVEVTVTLCCTGSVIAQHELTTVLNRNSRRNNLLGGCIRVFIGLDQFLGSIRQRAVKGQHLAINRHLGIRGTGRRSRCFENQRLNTKVMFKATRTDRQVRNQSCLLIFIDLGVNILQMNIALQIRNIERSTRGLICTEEEFRVFLTRAVGDSRHIKSCTGSISFNTLLQVNDLIG